MALSTAFSNFESSLEWLFQKQSRGIVLSLEVMKKLLEALDHPEKKLRFLHIAGTNGKGSVSAISESILCAAGYKTGLYTSPHLINFNERIRIAGMPIDDFSLKEGIENLYQLTYNWKQRPTFFELTTALALDIFARHQCDVVILETGLGGRLDATNCVPSKLACAMTTISLDHQELLGSTLSAIAREKAGIFQQGVPIVSAPQEGEVMAVLQEESEKKEASLIFIEEPLEKTISLGLAGSYQRWNAALTIQFLKSSKLEIPAQAYEEGLRAVRWPGRFDCQKIKGDLENQMIILDGAHNVGAAKQLVQTWKEEFPEEKPVLVFGALADKEWEKMFVILQEIALDSFFVLVNSPRALSRDMIERKFPEIFVISSLEDLFRKKNGKNLLKKISSKAPILLTGSLFLIGEALAILKDKSYTPSCQ